MKRLIPILLLSLLLLSLSIPALAQTPEPTLAPTPEATNAPAAPTPEIEATLTAEESNIVLDLLDAQPDLITDVTTVVVDQLDNVFERSQTSGLIVTVVVVIGLCGLGYLLYRSTPPDKRPAIERKIGSAGSALLDSLDRLDPLKDTDLENRFLRVVKSWLDEKMPPIIEASVQSAVATGVGLAADTQRSGKFEVLPPTEPANPLQG